MIKKSYNDFVDAKIKCLTAVNKHVATMKCQTCSSNTWSTWLLETVAGAQDSYNLQLSTATCTTLIGECFDYVTGLQDQNRISFFSFEATRLDATYAALETLIADGNITTVATHFETQKAVTAAQRTTMATTVFYTVPATCTATSCDLICNKFITGMEYGTNEALVGTDFVGTLADAETKSDE